MRRQALLIATTAALTFGAGLVNAESGADTARAPAKPENRFFVIGENSEYYRPGMPRPVVPTSKDADLYFLQEKIRFLERKIAAIEQQTPNIDEDDTSPADSKLRVTVARELPTPNPVAAPKTKKLPVAAKKTTNAAKTINVVTELPELPPLVIATSKPSEPISTPETVILPTLPEIPPRAEPVSFQVPSAPATHVASLTNTSEDSVIAMARGIIEAARDKVFELIASVAEPRREAVAHAVMATPGPVARGVIVKAPEIKVEPTPPAVPVQAMIETKKEWVVLYRFPNEQVSKNATEKLDAFRVPVGGREFIDGQYIMEVGIFEDEERANSRVLFLGHIIGIRPELRVRTVVAKRTEDVHG